MSNRIDYNDPRYAQATAEILQRHDDGEPEANIASAVRDFPIVTGLVEIVEENPPAKGSRRAVDLIALDAFISTYRSCLSRRSTARRSCTQPPQRPGQRYQPGPKRSWRNFARSGATS